MSGANSKCLISKPDIFWFFFLQMSGILSGFLNKKRGFQEFWFRDNPPGTLVSDFCLIPSVWLVIRNSLSDNSNYDTQIIQQLTVRGVQFE